MGFGVGVGAVQLVEKGIHPYCGVVLEHMARSSPSTLHSPSVAEVHISRLERVPSHAESLSSEPDLVLSMVRQNSTPASQVVAEPSDSGVQSTPVQDHVVQSIPPPPLPYPPCERLVAASDSGRQNAIGAAAVMTAARSRSVSIICVVDRPGSGLCVGTIKGNQP